MSIVYLLQAGVCPSLANWRGVEHRIEQNRLLAFLEARETESDMNLRLEARKQLAILARERGYNE